ncbi:MAG TPA: exodeoxyribonuclease VII large subunit, partial [Thermoanaerobaculia bacterium]|nr:exodeoxyribonuclease VII large subunit [Thermoanaerobaculia bacterium]
MSVSTLSLFETTFTVSELCAEVKGLLASAFPTVWVVGELQRVKASPRGHLYFELTEKGGSDEVVGKLEAVLWKTDHQRVARVLAASGQRLADGQEVRLRGNLDFFAAGGRLQLCVREVDPAFTLGQLERRRRETLAALAADGLLERNRALPLAELPLRVALVTSAGSAAYHDFLSGLAASGYGFQVVFVHASVQGREAEREVVSALAALARARVDCAVLVRGGGSRTDLAAFDSRAIAEAVARAPYPVLTGLGHEIDRAIADHVAHTALKTPTMAAEFLVERVARAEQRTAELRRRLLREGAEPLRAGRE